MKTITYILISLALLISYGCDTNVLFEGPMPPGVLAISTIPGHYQGTYLCESDSSIIHATERAIVRESYMHFTSPLDRIRETQGCQIKNDSLFMPWSEECIAFDYLNDSTIAATVHKLDTLFKFRDEERAKYYKGRLFLNARVHNSDNWITSMLTRAQDGTIEWKQIQMPEQIEKVEAITQDFSTKKDRKDNTIYIMNPTLVEFDKILEKEYVRDCDVFTPIYQTIQKRSYYE